MHELTDGSRIIVQVPAPQGQPRVGLEMALFTDLIPGIEPDLSSYPHEVLGVWAWNGEFGAFWSQSPSIPLVEFGPTSPTGTATYDGDAVGLHVADGTTTKYVADVKMVADLDSYTMGGEVNQFRSVAGEALGPFAVTLAETGVSADGTPFEGETAIVGVSGSGTWGARWSDGEGWTMGGTFGFAADDESVVVLGAFSACSCASTDEPDPDDPVTTD